MTPVLAAGFNEVSSQYQVPIPRVALTTGLYMMGLGVGSVVASPTAILFGKRPVYLVGIILFIVSAVWCAVSPNFPSLIFARVVMGMAVSPVECLPSATVAEIFYLHERAYRLGIYTLLLLSGKNLIPLVSAAIIQGLSWQWVFWYTRRIYPLYTCSRLTSDGRIVAMIVGFCFVLMFLFVPETFWDRTPRPHLKGRKVGVRSLSRIFPYNQNEDRGRLSASGDGNTGVRNLTIGNSDSDGGHSTIAERRLQRHAQRVGFANESGDYDEPKDRVVVGSEPTSQVGICAIGVRTKAKSFASRYPAISL